MLNGLQHHVGSKARVAVGVDLQRQRADGLLDARHQRGDPFRAKQPARVLQEDGIDAQPDQFLRLPGIVVVVVDRAVGVDEATGDIQPMLPGGPDGNLQIAHVVQRIIGRVVAHAVGGEALRGQFHHIVGKELEREQALPAGMDDERRFGDPLAENPHTLPGILPQVAHADIEHRATDEIDRLEPGPVQSRSDIPHHGSRHPRRPQALMGIAQRHVDQPDGASHGGDLL